MSEGAPRTASERQISELIASWARSVQARDIDGILANHSPDIVMFDVPPPVKLRGIEAYKKSWELFLPWLGESGLFALSDVSVTTGDDVAFCHALIRCAGPDSGGEFLVRLTVGCRKIDRQWTVTHEHHSVPST